MELLTPKIGGFLSQLHSSLTSNVQLGGMGKPLKRFTLRKVLAWKLLNVFGQISVTHRHNVCICVWICILYNYINTDNYRYVVICMQHLHTILDGHNSWITVRGHHMECICSDDYHQINTTMTILRYTLHVDIVRISMFDFECLSSQVYGGPSLGCLAKFNVNCASIFADSPIRAPKIKKTTGLCG